MTRRFFSSLLPGLVEYDGCSFFLPRVFKEIEH